MEKRKNDKRTGRIVKWKKWLLVLILFISVIFCLMFIGLLLAISNPGPKDCHILLIEHYTFEGVVMTDNNVVSNANINIKSLRFEHDGFCVAHLTLPESTLSDMQGKFNFEYIIADDATVEVEIQADGCTTYTELIYDMEWLIDVSSLQDLVFELEC